MLGAREIKMNKTIPVPRSSHSGGKGDGCMREGYSIVLCDVCCDRRECGVWGVPLDRD